MIGTYRVAPLLLLGGAIAAPAGAQQSGVAMTVESGGRVAGCVTWSHQTEPKPSNRKVQQVVVSFELVNGCGRAVRVMIAHQTADFAQRIGDAGGILLVSGETYGTAKSVRNYVFFNPPTDRFLNFWVFQSDHRFDRRVIPNMSRCVPDFQPARNDKRHYPACPPSFRYE